MAKQKKKQQKKIWPGILLGALALIGPLALLGWFAGGAAGGAAGGGQDSGSGSTNGTVGAEVGITEDAGWWWLVDPLGLWSS